MQVSSVQQYTFKKFLPSIAVQFFLILSYVFLQDIRMKVLVETGLYESLSSAYVWGGLPLSILFVLSYFKITNTVERQHHLTVCLIPFAVFFLLYAYVFHPHRDSFHISTLEFVGLMEKYPGFGGLIQMYAHWATSLLIMLIDIWSSFVIGVLFWQFMNDTTSLKQARVTYPLFGIGVAFSTSIGLAMNTIFNHSTVSYEKYLAQGITLIVFFWACALLLQKYMYEKTIMQDKTLTSVSHEKLSLGTLETFGYVFTSRYLGCVALMVISFGIMINLMDHLCMRYKMSLMQAQSYMDSGQASLLLSFLNLAIGISIALLSIRLLNKQRGWKKAAMVTPIVMVLSCLVVFVSLSIKEIAPSTTFFILVSSGLIIVQQIKNFFFKPLIEMAYIPLPSELKVKGKATIDLAIDRFSIAFGAPLFTIISIIVLKWDASIRLEIVAISIIIFLSILYSFCVKILSKEFEELSRKDS